MHDERTTPATLRAILNTLIPPAEDGRLPGAGDIGIEDMVGAELRSTADGADEWAKILRLAHQGAAAREQPDFQSLAGAERTDVLRALQSAEPDAFAALVASACKAYYQHPRVVVAIGLEDRPPFPAGYTVDETDPSLLAPVRRRSAMYKKC